MISSPYLTFSNNQLSGKKEIYPKENYRKFSEKRLTSEKRKISIDTLLLLILVISTKDMNPDNLAGWRETYPWINYLLPAKAHLVPMGDPLKPLYNFIKIFLLFSYILIDTFSFSVKKGTKWPYRGKLSILSLLIFITVIAPTFNLIMARHHIGPSAYAHDGAVVQIEEAVKFLFHGENPYSVTYEKTPVRDAVNPVIWEKYGLKENPIIHHFPYPPFSFLSAIPFYKAGEILFGWYDQRFLYLIAFILLLFFACKLTDNETSKISIIAILSLNPLTTAAMKEGMNDLFLLFWIVLLIFFLKQKKTVAAAIVLALACGIKQMAWVFVPFFFLYLYDEKSMNTEKVKKVLASREMVFFAGAFLLIFLPFLLWDFQAFRGDILSYHAGKTAHPYPIRGDSGYGFSNLLIYFGLVNKVTDYYPFTIIQILLTFPLLFWLLYKQLKDNTMEQMLTGYTVMLSIFLFFGRYFAANYITFILSLFAISFFMDIKDNSKKEQS